MTPTRLVLEGATVQAGSNILTVPAPLPCDVTGWPVTGCGIPAGTRIGTVLGPRTALMTQHADRQPDNARTALITVTIGDTPWQDAPPA